MKSIRIGNDIRIEWPIVLSGDVSKLQELDLTVEVRPSAKVVDWHNYIEQPTLHRGKHSVMMNGGIAFRPDIGDGKEHCHPHRPKPAVPCVRLPYHIEDNTLIAMWTADRQFAVGDYDIILYAHKNEGGQAVCDQYRFVRLVAHSAQADAPDDSGIEAVIAMQPVTLKLAGLSAYEVAVINGFNGTEEEWLESLKVFTIENLTPENLEIFLNGMGFRGVEKIDVDNLDSLADDKRTEGKKPMYYIVTHTDEEKKTYVVGTLAMFSDIQGGVLTQELTTHLLLDDNGNLTLGHNDKIVFKYCRSFGIKDNGTVGIGQWSKWTDIIRYSDMERLMKKIFPLNITVTGGGVYKKGTTQAFEIKWVIYDGDTPVTPDKVTVNGEEADVDAGSKIFINVKTTTTYTVVATYDGVTVQGSTTATFVNPSYFGAVSPSFSPTEESIKALAETVKNTKAYSVTLSTNNQKVCYAYPSSFGALTSIKDVNGYEYINSFTRTTVNVNGEDYYVYLLTDASSVSDFRLNFN